jgi:cyclopropane fatty-acyl-phospholipid synthase-like methyltransferase
VRSGADKETAFYTKCFDAHGHTAKGVGWFSESSQRARFYELEAVTQWHGKTVCDVGCGMGDLFDFIKQRSPETKYVGIDSHEPYIEQAQRAYPSGDFRNQDLLSWDKQKQFEVVVASGAFNIRRRNHYTYLMECIKKMVELSTGVVCFNVLKKTETMADSSPLFYYWDVSELLTLVREKFPNATVAKIPETDGFKSRSDITILIRV